VLAQMELTDESWHLVKNTPKVTDFLGGKGRPTPISDSEAERILHQVQEGIERPKPSVTLMPAERRISLKISPPASLRQLLKNSTPNRALQSSLRFLRISVKAWSNTFRRRPENSCGNSSPIPRTVPDES